MIPIIPGLTIAESEISFTASRSGGPGGQNVNKVSSKVTLAFNVLESAALSEEQKRTIMKRLATRINKEGTLQIISQRTRSQEINRLDALSRFAEVLRRALTPRRLRVRTSVPQAIKAKRLEEKKKRAVVKRERSGKGWDS